MERLTWDGYAAAWAGLHGGFDARQATRAVRGWLRVGYGVGSVLSRLRVAPTAVTTTGLLLSLLVPATTARHGWWPFLAALLVLLSALADTVDGAIAVIRSRVTRLGSVYDSLADRIGEAAWAAALWLLGVPGLLAASCCAVSWLHEYLRSLATAAGMTTIGSVTVGERPTRVSAAAVGLLFGGAAGLVSADLGRAAATFVTTGWLLLGVFGLRHLLSVVRHALR
jgi:CDP-diacylglycerol--glycerol-3-phosphate 3-phosphatidyltransferase